ncbi:glycerophosphodiester phosphodiesterase [Nocardia salmonicida]|uniref:glycerophosphodiester phosphodiesterase n=1 Tax=Nocardia salmonicida TaxID=53431 RepID=UPI0007A4FD49|nr:glycerophosphodiester phosphodiesterase family protein [Nocardia salmonicida]
MPTSTGVTVVAHRGLAPGLPENTLAAFRGAITLDVDAIEIDLRVTADGHLVVMHDDTVDRTTDGHGRVADLALAEIKTLDAGSIAGSAFSGERIPTYREALEVLQGHRMQLLLDIKDCPPEAKEEIVGLTDHFDASCKVILGPRTVTDLHEFKQLDPRLRTLALVPGRTDLPPDPSEIAAFLAAGADIVRLWPAWLLTDPNTGAQLIESVVARGAPVWTCADTLYGDISADAPENDLKRLVDIGVTGILTNLPELLMDIVR